jgi:hypothetical protein
MVFWIVLLDWLNHIYNRGRCKHVLPSVRQVLIQHTLPRLGLPSCHVDSAASPARGHQPASLLHWSWPDIVNPLGANTRSHQPSGASPVVPLLLLPL